MHPMYLIKGFTIYKCARENSNTRYFMLENSPKYEGFLLKLMNKGKLRRSRIVVKIIAECCQEKNIKRWKEIEIFIQVIALLKYRFSIA